MLVRPMSQVHYDRIGNFNLFIALCLLILLTLMMLPNAARAQTQTIPVLVDRSFQTKAEDFLSRLQQALDPQTREAIRLVPRVVGSEELEPSLAGSQWALAIVDSRVLRSLSGAKIATPFDMPFAFRDFTSVLDFEQSY